MPRLPNINLDPIRPVALDLPPDRYLAKLVEVEKYVAKRSGNPCLRWWWEIIDEPYEGQQIDYYTGNGTNESHPSMNRLLNKVLEVLGFEDIADINVKKLRNRRFTLVVQKNRKGWTEIVSILPIKYYSY